MLFRSLHQLVDDVFGRGPIGIAHAEVDDVFAATARGYLHLSRDVEDVGRKALNPAEFFHDDDCSEVSSVIGWDVRTTDQGLITLSPIRFWEDEEAGI